MGGKPDIAQTLPWRVLSRHILKQPAGFRLGRTRFQFCFSLGDRRQEEHHRTGLRTGRDCPRGAQARGMHSVQSHHSHNCIPHVSKMPPIGHVEKLRLGAFGSLPNTKQVLLTSRQ